MFQKGFNSLQHFVKTGAGQQVATFPWITSDFGDLGNSPYGNKVPGFQLGFPWFDQFGNSFTLKIQRAAALAVGNTAQWYTLDTGGAHGTDTATGASTVRIITLTTGGLVAQELVTNGAFIYDEVIARTGTPLTDGLKIVKANTASTVTISNIDTQRSNNQNDGDAYVTAPANTDALTFIRPYQTQIFPTANATTGMVCGVAVSAVVQNDWCFQQIAGLAMVVGLGNTTAIAANAPVVPDGTTAGAVKGSAATSASAVGISAAAKATAAGLFPVWLTNVLTAC